MGTQLRRLAIVNRGEAAARLIIAARELVAEGRSDLRTIALHTAAERRALFVREADEALCFDDLGPPGPTAASPYLDHDLLERALAAARADSVWPGWGFVAEDADFAERCERLGLTFVGPSAAVMRRLGDKIAAKRLAEEAGVPVAPWSGGPVATPEEALAAAGAIGYPLVVKASAGGGGRGIRMVRSAADLPAALASAAAEAGRSFGDPTVFLERVVERARHVEVQVVADCAGTVWAVGVRDCSIQRRNQKVIEESRSTALDADEEASLRTAAERLCASAGYRGAGTVEFLWSPTERTAAFLEVNTRLQVEHPVTEVTTGLDLVKLQLHVAAGGLLEGDPPPSSGHAFEARLNAEDPSRGFAPAPGTLELLDLPVGPGIRVDTGVAEGDVIPPEYDSMIAKVIAWGADRDEARARLRRALEDLAVVVRGGMTNKSFLLDLLARPEVADGDLDTGWLDRLTAGPATVPATAPVALLAAAVDAAEAEAALERARFLVSAARGRPAVRTDLGVTVELRHGGHAYRVDVARTGPGGHHRVGLDGQVVDLRAERLTPFRSRITIAGRTHRVTSSTSPPDHVVEVDGAATVFSRDDGGVVRAPSAAVVVAVPVAVGEVVAAGDRLVVVESMKMESAVTAPVAGRVAEVMVAANVQVDAGASLVRLEPLAGAPSAATSPTPRLRLDGLGQGEVDAGRALELVRSCLAGFDVEPDEARRLLAAAGPADPEGDIGLLALFADLSALSRHRRGDDEGGDTASSARERFRTYLRTLDPDREGGLPERFRSSLLRALAHHGVRSLERTPELEEALHRIFVASTRAGDHVPLVLEALERLSASASVLAPPLADELRDALDRLIVATQLRFPVVGNLARSARYRSFDQPLIEGVRRSRREAAEADVTALLADSALTGGSAADRDVRVGRLVASPQPLLPLLAEHAGGAADPLLEVLTRRYYRIRDLEDVRLAGPVLTAGYRHKGRRVAVVAALAEDDGLGEVLRRAADAASALDAPDRVVVDLYVRCADQPDVDALAGLVTLRAWPTEVERIAVAVWRDGSAGDIAQRTFLRSADGGFAEDPVVRGMHPMITRRLHLWRLENFDLTRLPSVPEVFLFDAVARANPADERLIALGEVRDLTPVREADGLVSALPELEQVLAACLDGIRLALADHPRGPSLAWNRVQLHVWPPVETPVDELLAVASRLAPLTEGLGLEQVVVQARVADRPGGELHEVVVRVGNAPGTGFFVRVGPAPTEPMQPLDAYTQKVIASQRRGAVYPYELVPLVAGEGGTFVEHDLDTDSGALVPVDRLPGGNTAAVVVGLVRTPTARHPEGMARVVVLGDPTKGLGSIAEAECRRVLAALDLASALGVPVDWFALSAGAKIAMDSGTENLDWVGRVLRRLVEHTQAGGEVNVVVTGINVGAQPYWNAEATMLMHTRGTLVMTPDSAMVLTGKQALDQAGGVSAEDNLGLGGYERIMGPNGQAQHEAADVASACRLLLAHHSHAYVVPGERFPRPAASTDPVDRDVRTSPHLVAGTDLSTVGDIFSDTVNRERKKPFDVRALLRAVIDADHPHLERWAGMRDAETAVVFDAHLGGQPVVLLGVESRPLPRSGAIPADGPDAWSAGTLFPLSSKKLARAINAASGRRPVVLLANLSGFDGSPESLRKLQLEYGAEIGRAVVNFDGPFVLCVVSRYHGGAFVVLSATLNDSMEVLAVEGSFASVIGGGAAAAVVFGGEVGGRTRADPRVRDLEARIAEAPEDERASLRIDLAEAVESVRLEKLGEVAAEFDAIHTVERARDVGSVHRIIPAARLRPELVDAVQRGMTRFWPRERNQ